MRRRHLFTLAAGASAVLCVAACVLWVRSYKSPDRFSAPRGSDRYTVVSAAGRLTLFGPPPPAGDPEARRAAADTVARLNNDQIRWDGWFPGIAPMVEQMAVDMVEPGRFRYQSPAYECDQNLPA